MRNATSAPSGTLALQVTRGLPTDRALSVWELAKWGLPRPGITREVAWYRVRNLRHFMRGYWRIVIARLFRLPHHYGQLRLVKTSNGRIVDYGIVSLRVVTTAGVAYIAGCFDNTNEAENMKYHGFGTGGAAEAVGNTGLTTELTTEYAVDSTRPTGSPNSATTNVYTTVGLLDPDAAVAITEHGVFSAASAGTLLDRTLFSAVNLAATGDTLQATYALTFASGG